MILDSDHNKKKILKIFLEICDFEGITEETLSKAFDLSGINSKFKNILFENGCFDLIDFFIEEEGRKIAEEILNISNFKDLKVREKIKLALYIFFDNQQKQKQALRRMRSFCLDVRNISNYNYRLKPLFLILKYSGKISDFIWKAIEDKSTDFNFYTKRLTLAKIITKSLIVFFKDEDEKLEETKRFIDLQIEKIIGFEKFKAKVRNFSMNFQEKSCDLFFENGRIKTINKILKEIPFVRLFR